MPLNNPSPSAMGPWVPNLSGRYVSGPYVNATTFTAVADQVRVAAILVPRAMSFDRIAAEVTTAGSGGTPVLRLGIYGSLTTGVPGALLLDAGTVDASTTGVKELTINHALGPGLYWLACAAQGATSQPALRGWSRQGVAVVADGTSFWNGDASGYQRNSVSGALPDPFGSDTITSVPARLGLRAV